MKIHYALNYAPQLATHRLRVGYITPFLEKRGIVCSRSEAVDDTADFNIFIKHFGGDRTLSNLLVLDKSQAIFDICDNYFIKPEAGFYKFMCENSEVITCSSKNLQKLIKEETGRDAYYIPEPLSTFYAGTRQLTKDKPRILWFGNKSNIFSVIPLLDSLQAFEVTIITDSPPEQLLTKYPFVKFLNWSPETVEEELLVHDIVLVPQNNDEWGNYKSMNRAVDSLAMGCHVITNNWEVYKDLKDYIYIGDILEGIQSYIDNYEEVCKYVQLGQKHVIENYNPNKIASIWEHVFKAESNLLGKGTNEGTTS